MKLNVLLVDDSTVIRKMLKRVLAESNLPFDKVLEAGDGQQALTALASDTVHLVLCDVNTPVMDGLEFLQTMRQNPAWQSLPGRWYSRSPITHTISISSAFCGTRAHAWRRGRMRMR